MLRLRNKTLLIPSWGRSGTPGASGLLWVFGSLGHNGTTIGRSGESVAPRWRQQHGLFAPAELDTVVLADLGM